MRKKRYAYRGCLTGEGSTVAIAKRKLDEMVDKACEPNRPHIECRDGYVLVVCATPQGWERSVIHPDQIAGPYRPYRTPCVTMLGWCDRDEAIEGGRAHIAQLTWNFDRNDGLHVQQSGLSESGMGDLMRWIKFQRDYRAAKDAGKNDAEAFSIATNDPRYHHHEAA